MLRSMWWIGLVMFHQLHAQPARACGATPDELVPLLPAEGAVDVPLNAALFASANLRSAVQFDLSEVTDGNEDGGGLVSVPLIVECEPGGEGALCLARPEEPLKPRTRYLWGVRGEDEADTRTDQTFETGEASSAVWIPQVSVTVVQNVVFDSHPCGGDRLVTLKLGSQTPAVVFVPGLAPGYVMHAQALSPQDPDASWNLYQPPDCFELVVYDQLGASERKPEICPNEVLAPTRHEPDDDTGSVMDAGAAEPSEADGGAEEEDAGNHGLRDAEAEPPGAGSANGSDAAAPGTASTDEREGSSSASPMGSAGGDGGCAVDGKPNSTSFAGWVLALGLALAARRRHSRRSSLRRHPNTQR